MGISGCTPSVITPGIVTFDPTAFKAAYPMFGTLSDLLCDNAFALAQLYLDNSCCSVVKDAPTRAVLLNLATAHLCALLYGVNGQPPQGIVGRVSQATEGSVSVSAELLQQTESAGFWQQTQWGNMFWIATLRFRTARYIAPCDGGGSGLPWNAWPQ